MTETAPTATPPPPEGRRRVLVIGDLEPSRLVCTLLIAGLGGLLGALVLEWVLAATVLHEGLLQGLYTSARLVATVGPASADLHGAPGWYLVVSAVLMLVGIAFTGALVAGLVDWIVGSRTAALVGPPRVPTRGHVVVSGLGQVGLRVAQLLRELKVPVAVVERLADAPNLAPARADRIPVVVGDASARSSRGPARIASVSSPRTASTAARRRGGVAAGDSPTVDYTRGGIIVNRSRERQAHSRPGQERRTT